MPSKRARSDSEELREAMDNSEPKDCYSCYRKMEKGWYLDCNHRHKYCERCKTGSGSGRESEADKPFTMYCNICRKQKEVKRWKVLRREPPKPLPIYRAHLRGASKLVLIEVGKDSTKEEFRISEDILTKNSAYFEKILNGNFAEGKSKTVTLADTSPRIFGLINEYLTTGSIEVDEHSQPTPKDYFELWMAADYFIIPSLMDYAPYLLVKAYDEGKLMEVEHLCLFYDTSPQLLMQKFIVDILVWTKLGRDPNFPGHASTELLHEVLNQLFDRAEREVKCPLDDVKNYYVKIKVEGEEEVKEKEKTPQPYLDDSDY